MLRETPVDYKAPLTGSYTALLAIGDMYATDDLGLILLLWRPGLTCNCMSGSLFTLKLIPALLGFTSEITVSRLQTWSDVVRCGPM